MLIEPWPLSSRAKSRLALHCMQNIGAKTNPPAESSQKCAGSEERSHSPLLGMHTYHLTAATSSVLVHETQHLVQVYCDVAAVEKPPQEWITISRTNMLQQCTRAHTACNQRLHGCCIACAAKAMLCSCKTCEQVLCVSNWKVRDRSLTEYELEIAFPPDLPSKLWLAFAPGLC